jgi:hypothetical protein
MRLLLGLETLPIFLLQPFGFFKQSAYFLPDCVIRLVEISLGHPLPTSAAESPCDSSREMKAAFFFGVGWGQQFHFCSSEKRICKSSIARFQQNSVSVGSLA